MVNDRLLERHKIEIDQIIKILLPSPYIATYLSPLNWAVCLKRRIAAET